MTMYSRVMQSAAVRAGPALALAAFAAGQAARAEAQDEGLFIVKSSLNPKEFVSFPVIAVEPVSHNTKRVRFGLPTKHHELGLSIASCLVTKADIDGKAVVRPYTPVTKEHTKGHFDLVVKSYEQGKMSQHIGQLKVGDSLLMKGPFKKIDVQPNMKKAIGMVAGGTGITPMLQVIQKLLADPRDTTEIRLLYANNTHDDILLKNMLDALALVHPRFKVYYTLAEAPEGWNGYSGYITKEMLAETMPPPSDDHLVMVCGPPPMMKALSGEKKSPSDQGELTGALAGMKYKQDQVFKF